MDVTTALDKVENEISILEKLDHPNVVGLISAIDDPHSDDLYYGKRIPRKVRFNLYAFISWSPPLPIAVLEFADAGAIMKWDNEQHRYVANNSGIKDEQDATVLESKAFFVIYDIANALKYCK